MRAFWGHGVEGKTGKQISFDIQKFEEWGWTAQQLRARATVAEDLGSVPSIHTCTHNVGILIKKEER